MFTAFYGRYATVAAGLSRVLCACLLLASSASNSMAAGTILSTGFESPHVPGPLAGQLGWVSSGTGTTSANVQSSVVNTGSQALTVTRTANSNRRWAVPNLSGYPTQRFVAVDWDMRVAASGGTPGSVFGPFFGVEAYDADSGVSLLGSLGVDATTGDILYQLQDTGELRETGRTVAFDQWNQFKLVFDFANDSYKGWVNSILVADTGFVDRINNLNNFTDADIATFAASFDPGSQAQGGSAVFDNFVVRDGLPGDYDADGKVDAADYAPWRASFGMSVNAGRGADGNSNGIVDAADYVVWRNNLGQSLFPGAGAGSVVVPEPAGIVIALLAMPGLAIVLRRRR